MGYVHDTHMTQYIPPTSMHYVTGTWADAAGNVTDTIAKAKTAADTTSTINIPLPVPSNSSSEKGSLIKSIEIDYEVGTAALDALSAVVNLVERGADGADAVVAAQAFTYDTGHDSAAERIDVDEHKMTLTLDTPVWLTNNQYMLVELTVDAAATSVFHMLGAFVNYTFRV
ncbi:MAG: hypothetical protein ACOYYS_19280 [Chloroflexota bacterium]